MNVIRSEFWRVVSTVKLSVPKYSCLRIFFFSFVSGCLWICFWKINVIHLFVWFYLLIGVHHVTCVFHVDYCAILTCRRCILINVYIFWRRVLVKRQWKHAYSTCMNTNWRHTIKCRKARQMWHPGRVTADWCPKCSRAVHVKSRLQEHVIDSMTTCQSVTKCYKRTLCTDKLIWKSWHRN